MFYSALKFLSYILNTKYEILNARGFTLIEILVAITIMSIVAVVSVPSFKQFGKRQELANTSSDLIRVLKQAQESSMANIDSCDAGVHNSWAVKLATQSIYRLVEVCDVGGALSEREKYRATLPSYLEMSLSGCSFPLNIIFTKQNSAFNIGDMPEETNCVPSPTSITITITDKGSTPQKTTTLSIVKDGIIRDSNN
jgi:prepilin-type N-terminal cleavage/methylation domain-containing protein